MQQLTFIASRDRIATALFVLAIGLSTPVQAEVPVVKSDPVEVKAQVGGGVYVEHQTAPGFGADVKDQASGVRRKGDNKSIEAFAYAGLSGSIVTNIGRVFGVANSIATYTGFDGDSIGVAPSGTKRFALDEGYVGWSRPLFDRSFFHVDAFCLRAVSDPAGSKLYGVQGSAVWPDIAEFGTTYFKIYRSNNAANATARGGMKVVNFYGSAKLETGGESAKLKGGYTSETGSVRVGGEVVPSIDSDAEVFYASVDLALPAVVSQPKAT